MSDDNDRMYYEGYEDGFAGRSCRYPHDADYDMGWTDGDGDRELGVQRPTSRPVDDLYYLEHVAPSGFSWAGYKATPGPGDWYLSKNGNAIEAKKVRGNNQKRHILIKGIV